MADEKKASKAKKPTAQKRDTQNAKRKERNRSVKSQVKTSVRSFEKELSEKKETAAKSRLGAIFSLIDKGVKKGIYKLNKASRLKSKFTKNL